MMRRITAGTIILLIGMVFSCGVVFAAGDTERMRDIDMDLLRRCAPRPAGMGGAFTAVGGDAIGLFWNPAAAIQANRLMISGNHSLRHFPDGKKNLDQFDSDTTAILIPLEGDKVLGAGFTVPGEWGIDHMDTNGVIDGGEKFKGRERMLVFGEADGGKRTSTGGVVSNWSEYRSEVGKPVRRYENGVVFSFFYEGAGGATYGINVKGLSALITSGEWRGKSGAVSVGVGAAYRGRGRSKTTAAVDVEAILRRGGKPKYRLFGGVERRFEDRAWLRVGSMDGLPTYGGGVKSGSLRLDYAVVKDLLPRVVDKDLKVFGDGHFLSYSLQM